jgi:hypothetical protein
VLGFITGIMELFLKDGQEYTKMDTRLVIE